MGFKEFIGTTKGKAIVGGAGAAVAVGIAVAVLLQGEGYRSIAVDDVRGSVDVTGETNNGQAYKGERLYSGDDVNVQKASELTMVMDNDKYVYADEETHFRLEANSDTDSSRIKIILDKGSELNVLNSKLGENDSYEVDTPNSTMSVRGTKFRVTVYTGPDGFVYTLVEVEEGEVLTRLKTADGTYNGVEKVLTAGQSALIRGNSDISEFVVSDTGDEIWVLDYSVLPRDNVDRLIALLERADIKVVAQEGKTESKDKESDDGEKEEDGKVVTVTEQDKDTEEDIKEKEDTSEEDTSEEEEPVEHEHVGVWSVTAAPTCTQSGKRREICKICGKVMQDASVPATGHKAGGWITTANATCMTPGTRQSVCSVCGAIIGTESIPATGHVPGGWVETVHPTCDSSGSQSRFCVYCGLELESSGMSPLGHDYDENGRCRSCGNGGNGGNTVASNDQSCDAIGHDFQETNRYQSSTGGMPVWYVTYTCTRCGASMTVQE